MHIWHFWLGLHDLLYRVGVTPWQALMNWMQKLAIYSMIPKSASCLVRRTVVIKQVPIPAFYITCPWIVHHAFCKHYWHDLHPLHFVSLAQGWYTMPYGRTDPMNCDSHCSFVSYYENHSELCIDHIILGTWYCRRLRIGRNVRWADTWYYFGSFMSLKSRGGSETGPTVYYSEAWGIDWTDESVITYKEVTLPWSIY